MSGEETAGTHVILECHGCDPGMLDDPSAIEALLLRAARRVDAGVLGCQVHRFRPDGVTAFVMLEGGHLSVHTWPEAGYAATDGYLCGPGDGDALSLALREELGAVTVRSVVVRRGRADAGMLQVEDHQRVPSLTLDCRGEALPGGIRVGRSPGRGLGLFATRDFGAGEVVYEAPVFLAPWQAEVVVETDLGPSVHSADSLGYEIHPQLVEAWPQAMRDAIVDHYQLQDSSPDPIVHALTRRWEDDVLVTSFDGLQNHSVDPRTILDWSTATLRFDECGRPRWVLPVRALRPIAAGDELLTDYRVTMFDFVAPDDWLP